MVERILGIERPLTALRSAVQTLRDDLHTLFPDWDLVFESGEGTLPRDLSDMGYDDVGLVRRTRRGFLGLFEQGHWLVRFSQDRGDARFVNPELVETEPSRQAFHRCVAAAAEAYGRAKIRHYLIG